MAEQYNREEFERFAIGIKKASDILRSKKPDYIFAPIVGAVPFVDLFSIADRRFDLNSVEYPPNSSRFTNREEVIDEWYFNFLKDQYHGGKMNIVCVDEVISGSSAVKGYREFQKSLRAFARADGERGLGKKVSYQILGIGEEPKTRKRNHGISKLVNQNIAQIVDVGHILTADNPDLNPVRLKIAGENAQHRNTYAPEIETFKVSEAYLNLLQDFAIFIGVDPSTVSVQNMGRMKESLGKYLRKK